MDNFIHDIEIKNFKSIRHQKIEGCKRINVFIGYPNVGKSNILEALSLLSFVKAGVPSISSICRIERFRELFFDGNIDEPICVKYAFDSEILLEFDSDTRASLKYLINSRETNIWESVREFRLDDNSSTIRKQPDDRDPVTYAKRQLEQLKEVVVKAYSFINTSFNRNLSAQSLSFPHGDNLFPILESNSRLRKEISELFSAYNLKLVFERGDDTKLRILKSLYDDTIFLIEFYQIADTLKRLIFHKAAIETNSNTVLLFEEPEAHMFPPYIKLFTNDVIDNETNQYFIATHSPFVLAEFLEKSRAELNVYVVGLENGETTIKCLSDDELTEVYQNGVDLFFNLESYL